MPIIYTLQGQRPVMENKHMQGRPHTQPYDTAGNATVEDGHVVLDGPDGVAMTLTAEAAVATGRNLLEAGERALRARGENNITPIDGDKNPDID